jgi:RNA polymerase sigma-70 factor (ECF subfamily)
VYCVIPRDLAAKLYEPLRRHFRDDPRVEVIVEDRRRERRRPRDRRADPSTQAGTAAPRDLRRIQNVLGRRFGDRRASFVEVDAPPLPRRARDYADRLVFLELVEPSAQDAEDLDTARVIGRIQAGERDEFPVLYLRYFNRVHAYLRLLLADEHEAEDATQQVFMRVLQALPRYQARAEPFRGWLFVIARNCALTELSKRSRIESRDIEGSPAREAVAPAVESLGALDWIADRDLHLFIERLPLAQRQVLFLRYAVGLTTSEVARVLSQSPEAVRQQHSRALRFLRARLTALGREPTRGDRIGARALMRRARVVRVRRYSLLSAGPTG